MEEISFEDFKKVNLCVGEIKAVKDHPNADKLYILLVDIGPREPEIQIVSGLKDHYEKEELVGKQIVLVKNLQPTVIRGVESRGMLLASIYKDEVILLKPERKIKIGAKIE